ncbi:MAG: hypothetical protein AB2L14_03625 [Candidatus Xenobiia bacterium LiM19]
MMDVPVIYCAGNIVLDAESAIISSAVCTFPGAHYAAVRYAGSTAAPVKAVDIPPVPNISSSAQNAAESSAPLVQGEYSAHVIEMVKCYARIIPLSVPFAVCILVLITSDSVRVA